MAKDVEKNAYIHFVDERDFKEASLVGKRKSKKNLTESSSDDDEVESDCSSEMKVPKKVAAAQKNSQKTKKPLKRSCIQ